MVAEAADLLRSYGISKVIGDKYSAEWVKEAFRSHAITYEWCDLDRSAPYLELLPAINSTAVELLDRRHSRRVSRRTLLAANDRIGLQPAAKIVARRVKTSQQACFTANTSGCK
jgi:hypothetical protein